MIYFAKTDFCPLACPTQRSSFSRLSLSFFLSFPSPVVIPGKGGQLEPLAPAKLQSCMRAVSPRLMHTATRSTLSSLAHLGELTLCPSWRWLVARPPIRAGGTRDGSKLPRHQTGQPLLASALPCHMGPSSAVHVSPYFGALLLNWALRVGTGPSRKCAAVSGQLGAGFAPGRAVRRIPFCGRGNWTGPTKTPQIRVPFSELDPAFLAVRFPDPGATLPAYRLWCLCHSSRLLFQRCHR
jgi:hypothetical protein